MTNCKFIDAIRSSINDGQGLLIRYSDRKGAETTRLVTPIDTLHGRDDILLAWCHERDALRHFFIWKILNADPCPSPGVHPTRLARAIAGLPPRTRKALRWNDDKWIVRNFASRELYR